MSESNGPWRYTYVSCPVCGEVVDEEVEDISGGAAVDADEYVEVEAEVPCPDCIFEAGD